MSLVRSAIESATALAGWATRGRRLRPREQPVKVNLGCGLAVAPGWLNVDASLNALVAGWPRPLHRLLYRASGANRYYTCEEYCALLGGHRFVHHDLAHGIPFADDCVDFVYSSHFLEHLFRPDALRLLRETHRVLRPGGVVRVCVPDLAHAIALYRKGEKERMLADYFFVEDLESSLARHKYMYDFELLARALADAGFRNIVRCAYREGRTPDLALLDNRPEETLYVEAEK
jgi:predicted SAM-dependent methyltransferase